MVRALARAYAAWKIASAEPQSLIALARHMSRDAPPEPTPAPSDAHAKSSLADRVGVVVGSNFVAAGINLAQSLILVRLLSKPDYGAWSFAMMLFVTGRDLGFFAIPDSILYFAPKGSLGQMRGLVRQSALALVVLAAIVGLVFSVLALTPETFLDGRSDLGPMLVLFGLTGLFAFPASVYNNAFIATDHHRASAGVNTVVTLAQTVGLLVPAWLGMRVEWLVVGYALTSGLRLLLLELLFRRLYAGAETQPFPGGLRAQLRYAVPLAATKFAGIFNRQLDKFVIGLFFSASAFAEFSVGATELPLVSMLPYSIATLMLPKFVEAQEKSPSREEGIAETMRLWHASIEKAAIVMLPIAAFLLIEAEPMMRLLYGAKYSAAALPFRVYTTLLPLRVTSYGIVLLAFGQSMMLLRSQLYGMVVNLVVVLALLPVLGMIGAPIAAVVTQVFIIFYMLYRINHTAKVGLGGIFPHRHYARTAAAALLASAPIIAVRLTRLTASWSAALEVGVFALGFVPLYLVFATWLGALHAEDRAFIARWIRLAPLRDGGRGAR